MKVVGFCFFASVSLASFVGLGRAFQICRTGLRLVAFEDKVYGRNAPRYWGISSSCDEHGIEFELNAFLCRSWIPRSKRDFEKRCETPSLSWTGPACAGVFCRTPVLQSSYSCVGRAASFSQDRSLSLSKGSTLLWVTTVIDGNAQHKLRKMRPCDGSVACCPESLFGLSIPAVA
jgi:hypothetical protein